MSYYEWQCQFCGKYNQYEGITQKTYICQYCSKEMKNEEIKIEIVSGVEGQCLLINDYRIAGNKSWGGGKVIKAWTVSKKDLLIAIKEALK